MGKTKSQRLDTMNTTLSISVIVPVFCNRDTLVELYERLHKVLANFTHEIIFVNDACPEGSLEVLRDLEKTSPFVQVVALSKNSGQHAAVLDGMRVGRGEWTVIMDADLQDPPEVIPDLLKEAETGYPVVFAGRRGLYESVFRLWTSWLFKKTMRWLVGCPSDAGMYVLLHRNVRDRVLRMTTDKPFIIAMIAISGFRMTSIPVVRDKRHDQRSTYTPWGRLRSAMRALTWGCRWRMGLLRLDQY
jgi:glycosyltransferase involved in cell wall biosynthesis